MRSGKAVSPGATDVVGKAVELDGTPYTVIGVMPIGFRFPLDAREAVYTPLHMNPDWAKARGMHWMQTVGRIKQGVSNEQARTDLNRVMTNLARAYPEQETGHTVARLLPLDVAVNSLDRFGKRTLAGPLGTLALAVLALLAIACVNVAGLLMARGIKRETGDGAPLGGRRQPCAPDAATWSTKALCFALPACWAAYWSAGRSSRR